MDEPYWVVRHLDTLLDGTYWPMAGWAAGNQGPAVSAAKSVFLVSALQAPSDRGGPSHQTLHTGADQNQTQFHAKKGW